MEIYQLNAFVKVVQTGSFTKAAELLGTQKAHLSRVVSQLEKHLGVRLLERTTRSLSLTEVGCELFERSLSILEAVDDAQRMALQTQGEPRGVLKLSCGVEFGLLMVNDWINQYLQSYPLVNVEADWSNRVVDLVHEGFDLAIRVGKLSDSSLNARKLGELHYGLFASPNYLQRMGTPIDAHALDQHELVMFTGGSLKQGWGLTHGDETVRISTQHARYRINNSYAVRDAVIAGLGIGCFPLKMAQSALSAGHIQALLPQWKLPNVPFHAVFPSAHYLTPKVRAFIDLAIAQTNTAE